MEPGLLTLAGKRQVAVICLETVIKDVIVQLERKAVSNVNKIYEYISAAEGPVTLKELQIKLEMKPGIVSGSLASLLANNRVNREKVARKEGNGRKEQWAYKTVAIEQQKMIGLTSE